MPVILPEVTFWLKVEFYPDPPVVYGSDTYTINELREVKIPWASREMNYSTVS